MDELLYIMIECRGMQSAQEALDEIKKLTPEMVMRSLIVKHDDLHRRRAAGIPNERQ